MSELSTVAIKDGHRGHLPHHANPLEAERADRISRLAGLERVATARQATLYAASNASHGGAPAYFDHNQQPQLFRERSTVGSASATGSVGGRTTWASGSDVYDGDRMSEDQDQDEDTEMEGAETGSAGGFSDEGASLVGFGEGARTPARGQSAIGSPVVGKAAGTYMREQSMRDQGAGSQVPDARMMDGSAGVVDTSHQAPPVIGGEGAASRSGLTGTEATERILRDRIARGEDVGQGNAVVSSEHRRDGAPAGNFS